jgi:hypothetical protein
MTVDAVCFHLRISYDITLVFMQQQCLAISVAVHQAGLLCGADLGFRGLKMDMTGAGRVLPFASSQKNAQYFEPACRLHTG